VDWTLIAALLLLGCATGFVAGLLGIGGGMLLVPFLTMLFTLRAFPEEHLVHMAIATSLATILFTSISSVRAHHKRGAVLWPVVKVLAPGILVGSLIGAQIAGRLPTVFIALFFGVFVGFSALQMLRDKKPKPSRELPRPLGMFGVGNGIGAVSALVGIGGGALSIPFMMWCNVPVHHAIGTSAAIGFPIAVAGTIGFIVNGLSFPDLPAPHLGYLYLPALFGLACFSFFLAPLGAKLAHKTPVVTLKRVYAVFLIVIATRMIWGILQAS